MSKKARNKIAEGLIEAIAVARGEEMPARLHVPAEFDVKAIRRKVSLSQAGFASTYGFTVEQIKAWEQGRARPLGGVRAYLMMIDVEPIGVQKLLEETKRKYQEAA